MFVYFWPCGVFVAAFGLSLVVASRDCSGVVFRGLLVARSAQVSVAAATGALHLSLRGPRAQAPGVVHGLSHSEACRISWGPGVEPVSPALSGGFLTTGPLGKPYILNFERAKRSIVFLWGLGIITGSGGRPGGLRVLAGVLCGHLWPVGLADGRGSQWVFLSSCATPPGWSSVVPQVRPH